MHDVISDIIDWDQANKAYMAGAGQSGERYIQRLEAADQKAEIEARWQHLPGGVPWRAETDQHPHLGRRGEHARN